MVAQIRVATPDPTWRREYPPEPTPLEIAQDRGWLKSNNPDDHDEWWDWCRGHGVPYLGVRERRAFALVHLDLSTGEDALTMAGSAQIQIVLSRACVPFPEEGGRLIAPDRAKIVHSTDDAIWCNRIPVKMAETVGLRIANILGREMTCRWRYNEPTIEERMLAALARRGG
jgi:hypothetical protein